jgi:GT2 family glycosyltransferase
MRPPAGKKIVLLGMMTRIPVAGVVWQTMHYLLGFQRLGYDVYYVETHARTPSMMMMSEFERHLYEGSALDELDAPDGEDGRPRDHDSARAASFISSVMRQLDMSDRWAFLALHDDGRHYGLSRAQLKRVYASAAALINLHGGTMPLPELAATGRLVYVETDPVLLQFELQAGLQETIDFLEPHCAFFSFAENYGNPDCLLPFQDRFPLRPTRQPVVLDLWEDRATNGARAFTTIGNWRQVERDIIVAGETYTWSKHREFLKFLDLPARTGQEFELALSSYEEEERLMLEGKGWAVRHALDFSTDTGAYRDYIVASRGEFTVAKDQNVRFRTGWFSDRSATYLAAGRPVVCQETGFRNVLPTGEGLLGFSTLDEAAAAVDEINSGYERHRSAAADIARECFSHEVVLGRLLDEVGVELRRRHGATPSRPEPFPPDLVLDPISRRPNLLPDETVATVMDRPVPSFEVRREGRARPASVVVVTRDQLVFTRLCLESVLAMTDHPSYELIVVDNASTDGTRPYLTELAAAHPNVRLVLNSANAGFAAACNQGLAVAQGEVLVLLNNDTLVAPGWIRLLSARLEDPEVGLVGPVTNRIGNEAEVETDYHTWSQFLEFAAARVADHGGSAFDIETLTMFCLATRRDVYRRIGPLDTRFEVGLLEDDDYSLRAREAGYRLLCAEEVFVHHFGESSFGTLVASGEYGRLLEANRKRFEEKWGRPWKPYERGHKPSYANLTERIRAVVSNVLPSESTVLVVSRGDEELLKLNGCRAWHFPQAQDGRYAGHHPANAGEAIAHLEALRARGGQYLLIPRTGLWWLDHYDALREHLQTRYRAIVREEETCVIFELEPEPS